MVTEARVYRESALVAEQGSSEARLFRESALVAEQGPSEARLFRVSVMVAHTLPTGSPRLHGRRASLSFGRTLGK